MKLIDTHTHLYLPEFDDDREEAMKRSVEAGVEKIYLPNIDSTSVESMLQLEKQYPDFCFAMMGLHPGSVNEKVEDELQIVQQWLGKRLFAGIGEIGLDYYWDITFKEQQLQAFRRQIEWALQYNLPISIHSRNATADCIAGVREAQNGKLKGVFHCFGGTPEEAQQIINLGFYLGIGGVVTFKNSGLDKVLENISINNIVLETDAPYLAPVPHRGKRNESSYISLVAKKLSEIYQLSDEEIATVTTRNAQLVFGN